MQGAVHTRRVWRTSCAALAALAVMVSPAVAQDGADEDQPERRYFSLHTADAYLELNADYRYGRWDLPGRRLLDPDREQRTREWEIEEVLGFRFSGDIIDPRVVNFAGDLALGLEQSRFYEKFDGLEQRDYDNGYLVRYDLRANFFTGNRLSGSAYALQNRDRINRRFQPSLDQERMGFGTSWLLNDETLPMELSFDYLETDRSGNRDVADDEHFTEANFRYGAKWNIADNHSLSLAYEHVLNRQEYQGTDVQYETSRDWVRLEHLLQFGGPDRHELRTLLDVQNESGDFARDYVRFGPQLTLRHSDTLQTLYRYQYNHENYSGLEVDSNRLDFQVVHQLYSNLTTTFDVFALREDTDQDVDTTQYGSSINWQYNRKNPYGRFHANLALAYDTAEIDGDNGPRIVLDEAHSFQEPLPTRLTQLNIIPGTIIVTDTTGTRIYQLGLDYGVNQLGNVTHLFRVPTGDIADGQTILVDYQYRTPADGQLDTIRVDFSLEQRFDNGLTPYYRFAYRNQEDDTSTGFSDYADRTDHHRLGVTYEKPRYTLGAELEYYDDSVEPYDAFHLDGRLRLVTQPDHLLDTAARFSRLFFETDDERNVSLLDVELDHRLRLSETWSTIGRTAYRIEDDSVDGWTHGWDVTAGLEYVSGNLSAELTFEYDRLSLPDSRQDDYGVFLRVRREFPDVFARR